MSDDNLSRFPKLNDANYAEWSIRMEAELIRRGLWSGIVEVVIDTTGKVPEEAEKELVLKLSKRSVQKMAEARAEMVLRVEDGQLSHMRLKDPMGIWDTLKAVHRARGFATSLALRRKFLTMKMAVGQLMASWIGFIRGQAFAMEEAGIVVSDQDRILALTMGLPAAYDPVIINFDATHTDLLTFDTVVARLLNEEARQASAISGSSVSDTALAAATPTSARTARSDITCHFCDKKGHYKSECCEKAK